MFPECIHTLTAQHGLTVSLLLGGLVGSVTHCTMMCSPFVLAQTESGLTLKRPARSLLLPYHLGRMTTYVGLGVLLHGVVNLAYLFSGARALISAPLLMLAAVLFLVSAFPSWANLFPWVKRLGIPSGLVIADGKTTAALMRSENPFKRYGLGVLLGFMPCGLVVAALMASATAQSTGQAALAMAAFSVGTMPALMALGLFGAGLKQRFPDLSAKLSRAAMVASSVWLFALAGTLIF